MSSSSSVTCVKYKRKREKKAAESHWGNLYCSTPFLSATLWLCRNPTLTHSTRSITPAAQTSSTGSNARDTGMFTGGLSVFITSLDTTFVVVFFAPKADSRLVSFCRGHSKPFELICCEIRRVICLKYNYSKRWESRDFRRGSFSRNARRFTFYLSILFSRSSTPCHFKTLLSDISMALGKMPLNKKCPWNSHDTDSQSPSVRWTVNF